jgi:hypothetical protein
MTDYSISDIAAVTGNRNDGMFGNDWAWIIILLLFGYGRGFGGGFGGGYGNPATQADLSAGFASNATLNGLNDIKLGQAGIQQALCQGFNGVTHQIADCCCATQRAIDGVNYNLATQSCDIKQAICNTGRDIIDNANANSRAILDFLTNDKIATLTAENQALKFQASQVAQNAFISANQEAQTAELIRRLGRDNPVPAYVVPNPNCCYNNGCGGF